MKKQKIFYVRLETDYEDNYEDEGFVKIYLSKKDARENNASEDYCNPYFLRTTGIKLEPDVLTTVKLVKCR